MANRSSVRKHSKLERKLRQSRRQLLLQQLDRRELLAGDVSDLAPRLISVNPSAGELLSTDENNILNRAPSELTFRFDGGQRLDPATLEGIRITGSGGDGTFDDGNETIVEPGYRGFGDSDRIVVTRFASPLPDDQYKIEIFGFDLPGANIVGLRNVEGDLFAPDDISADREEIYFEVEIGALVTAIVPQPIEEIAGNLVHQRDQIHVYFNSDPLSDPAGGPVTTGDPGAPSVVAPQFYKLFFTAETVENTDDEVLLPDSVTYDPTINRAVLTFPVDLSDWAPVAAVGGSGTLRLRVGTSENVPVPPRSIAVAEDESLPNSPGDSFLTSRDLGTSFDGPGKSVVIDSHISPVTEYQIMWPGAADTPGIRSIRANSQLIGRADTDLGIATLFYNFKSEYGDDTQGNRLDNAITPAQQQRLREVLDLYEQHLGVRFVESADQGLHIVTGDMRAIERTADVEEGGGLSIFRTSDADPGDGLLILDGQEDWYDGYGQSPDTRPSWFEEALRQVGSLLGIGDLFERPAGTAAGSEPALGFGLPTEPDYLSESDITLGQYLFRPESRDIDLYRFSVATAGKLTAETFSERLLDSSLLDTSLTAWRQIPGGGADDFELIARNDDFYSNDSFVGLDLEPGTYVVGVSASGNDDYNPKTENSGLGGLSEGRYQLRLGFEAASQNTITDTDGTPLDGDADGIAGGDYNFWFRTSAAYDGVTPHSTTMPPAAPRVLFVSKTGVDSATGGTIDAPLKTIDQAMAYAHAGDIIRLLPNAGDDDDFETLGDNRAFEIGRGGVGNLELEDGGSLEIKRGVTVMIDAGAILKLRGTRISVGSNSIDTDRSLSALQVVGTPILVDSAGAPVLGDDGTPLSGRVIFTSYDDQEVGLDTNPLQTTPGPGQWGGINFRNDVDYAQGRPVAEQEGIFVNYVGQADIRYGGGAVGNAAVMPIQLNESRPAVKYTIFRDSADSAISADPNSFEETNFHSPQFQRASSFTSDYDRVGPDLAGLEFENNSINGLFIRIDTPTVGQLEPMSVSGRFDDIDVTHVLSEQLIIAGTPGGPILESVRPSVLSIMVNPGAPAPTDPTPTLAAGTYDYRLTFVDIDGSETLASLPTNSATIAAGQVVRLSAIPSAPSGFVGRRLYRLDPGSGDYVFVAQLNKSQQTFTDTGITRGGVLDTSATELLRPRFDARLSMDAGIVMKIQTSRIETTFGADFYAEALDGKPIVFTSRQDDRYGAGGNFDTNNDGSPDDGGDAPAPGDWGGIVVRQGSTASLDNVLITFGGGNAGVEGGFSNFNAIEVLQGDLRLANSVLENNADGLEADPTRDGRGFNDSAALFVRGAQPIVIDTYFRDNAGAAISINPDALNHYNVTDYGRSTGGIDRLLGGSDNQGPLFRNNQLSGNDINGLKIRPEVLTSESVWDDTDIVHVVAGDVVVTDHHYNGGLRLEASPDESLVVKFDSGARLLATGRPLDIDDRIGGTLQIVGQPGFPVILTSLNDDSVGAGFTTDGRAQTDTDNASNAPAPGDWQGIQLDVFANNRNVAAILENEPALATAAEFNAVPGSAQFIGALATEEKSGDENERLGFSISGALSDDGDVDVYSFMAEGGTEVWLDIDRTTYSLDSVVELIDQNGNILVLSDDTFTEESDTTSIFRTAEIGDLAHSLGKSGEGQVETPNIRDAGFRVVLPGAAGEDAIYFVRVRSSNVGPGGNAADLLDPSKVRDGLSSGAYRLGIRLREADEVAGSIVQFADIRYAVNGIDLVSAPLHSPLTGEATEALFNAGGTLVDNNYSEISAVPRFDELGNLLSTDFGAISVSGNIGNRWLQENPNTTPEEDIDVFVLDLQYDSLETEISDPDSRLVPVTFDIDYADGIGRVNTSLSIYNENWQLILTGRDSNIADDVGSPLRGIDSENLDAGSAGVLDAHIGPVELPEGRYHVVVHSDLTVPQALSQFTVANNPLYDEVRVVPINSVRGVVGTSVEEPFGPTANYAAEAPIIAPALAPVPYSLEDVDLFVNMSGGLIPGGARESGLAVFDPFTGVFQRTIGDVPLPLGDLDFRPDGELFSYSLGPTAGGEDDDNVGNYVNISVQDASILNNTDDGITFRQSNANFDGTEDDAPAQLKINAMSMTGGSVFSVGTRDNAGRFGEVFPFTQNVMYRADSSDGVIDNFPGGPDRDFPDGFPYLPFFGPASQKFEVGVIDTGNPAFGGLGTNAGPGGTVTGLAANPDRPSIFYAVSDRGGIYEVNINNSSNVGGYNGVLQTTYLGFLAPVAEHTLGLLRFTSLDIGPQGTDGGANRLTLFATTNDGWMYAFEVDESGPTPVFEDAHVFAHGRRAIPFRFADGTPVGFSPVGLTFSTRESNPWTTTINRGGNAGHGFETTYDFSTTASAGGNSWYFGFPNQFQTELAEDDPAGTRAPGGARGSMVSSAFDLTNYASSDKPTVYFNYFLETEGRNSSPSLNMLDSFRVFASGDDGLWRLIGTNDSYRTPGDIEDYDYFGTNGIIVQEMHDNTGGWRQARIDISPMAGNSQVRLRFDFSTHGQMDIAQPGYRTELMVSAAEELSDGDTFTLVDTLTGNPVVYEIDLGFVIDVPSGNEITPGDSFDVTFGATTQTITFMNGGTTSLGQVAVDPNMTSSELAAEILLALDPAIAGVTFGQGSVGLTNATNVVNNATTSGVVISSTPGIDPASDQAVIVEGNLNTADTIDRVRTALVQTLGDPMATIEDYRVYTNRILIPWATVVDAGPFGANNVLQGDENGSMNGGAFRPNVANTAPGQNNEFEGLYIDDLIVGFAERGEMVLNAPSTPPGGNAFFLNPESNVNAVQPERPDEILTGNYSLEIRTSTEFGVPNDPGSLVLAEGVGIGRSFDTNDRLTDAVTLVAQPGGEIRDGDTFVLSDGTRSMTFEFDSAATPGVQQGNVAVPFDPRTSTATEVAASIRDAVNSQQVQLVLDIRAATSDSLEVGATTSNLIELFGDTVMLNPTAGRNLRVDMVASENYQDKVGAQTMPTVPVPGGPVVYELEPDTLARAYPTEYLDGATDTMVVTGRIGDRAMSDRDGLLIQDPLQWGPATDVDVIKIHLFGGDSIDIDMDALETTRGAAQLLALLTVNDEAGNLLATSLDGGQSATAPGESLAESFLRFVAPSDGYYYISIASLAGFGDYNMVVRPTSNQNDVLYADHHLDAGDKNRFRDQGQIIVESNFISDSSEWGIRADASQRDRSDISANAGILPRPGSVRLLRNQNTSRLVPGSVISNNVIVNGGTGGILFEGDASPLGQMAGPVPFGRIVNNTVVGSGTGIGIDVGVNASPTVVNNVMAGFDTGLRVDGSAASQTTIVGGNIFRDNTSASNYPLGNSSFNLDLPSFPNKALFTDEANRIFIPADGSLSIDSSFASIADRQAFFDTVKEPVGIGISPIVAPDVDAYGQPRVDDPDVQTPAGVGSNVFIDRGALDRADFAGPLASIATPVDFITGRGEMMVDGDVDGTATYITLPTGVLEFFEIQLLEPMGSGPNTDTVLSEAVAITEDGRRLVEGIDYNFGYSAASNTIRLTPLSGIWRPDAAYEITLNNRDRLVMQAPTGADVVDGDQLVVTDSQGMRAFLEFETGYVLSLPQTLTLVVPVGEGGSAGFRDGDRFEIEAPDGTVETFELNVFGDISGGAIEIPVASGANATQVRDAILTVLQTRTGTLDIAPKAVGATRIHLGSVAGHAVNVLSSPLVSEGVDNGVTDGDVLIYQSGTTEIQFEFDLDTDGTTLIDTNVPIVFSRSETYLELADKLADAIRDTDLRLDNPRSLGDGRIHLGGNEGDTLNTDNTVISQTGTPGVTDSLSITVESDASGFVEGDQFEIAVNGVPTVFEFTYDRNVAPGAEPITLVPGDSIDVIVGKMIGTIINAGIGLTPTDEGGGVIKLNEGFGVELDLLGFDGAPTPSLTSDGVPAGAVAVPVIPSPAVGPDGVAVQILAAVRSTPLLSEVFAPGGGSIWFSNTADIVGVATTPVDAIRDLAGNRLQPNRANEETQFTILMPNVSLDFGDAPDSYNTLVADNGARNTIGGRDLPRLGQLIDSESDGQASDDAGDLVATAIGGAGAVGPFVASATLNNAFLSTISSPTAADEGARILLQTAGQNIVLELDSDDVLADPSFIPVPYTPGMSAEDLADAIESVIRSSTELVGSRAMGAELLVYGGDEDGVPIGEFQANVGVASINGLFFDAEGNFLSFLNPLDSAIEAMVITTGGGLLDAWIDFNQDGTFDPATETVLNGVPVLDGQNRVRISTPSNAVDGLTWARFRLSRTGGQSPDGVAITGEVEDYQVRIASIEPAVLNDDQYSVDEDTVLNPTGIANNVLANDSISAVDPSSINVLVEDAPLYGTLTLDANGDFVYVPDLNYYGDDSFTYRLFGLAELVPGNPALGLLPVRTSEVGTVSITVNPVNDVPRAVDKQVNVLEDLPAGLRITAAELLVDALPNDLTGPTAAPWDESDQSIRITAIGDGTTSVMAPTGVGAESATVTTGQGMLVTANFLDGSLVDVVYQPTNNYNFENPTNPLDPLPALDTFTYTVTDDGRTVYFDGTEIPPLPEESVTATVTVTVDPVNDPPEFDFVSEHVVAEDSGPVSLVAVNNLLPGPANALDESGQTVSFTLTPDPGNRAGLFLTPPAIDSSGNLTFETAEHQNGTVIYTVVAMDDGPNDPAIGDDPTADPVTLTITISPVNDRPEFDGAPVIEVLEDTGPFAIQYATNILPGPPSAGDEGNQNVAFQVRADAGNPAGLLTSLPTVNSAGVMQFTSGVDEVGSAVFYVSLVDDGGLNNPGDENTADEQTVTIHVRPVNDRPRVTATDPVRYTTLEDNALVIPVTSGANSLLSQFSVGPDNEADPGPGGNQTIRLVDFGTRRTSHGSVSTVVDGTGEVTELIYTPDLDYNSGGLGIVGDRIYFTAADDGTTWDLNLGGEVADPLTADYEIELVIEPVNDEPSFDALTRTIRRLEDVGTVSVPGWATNITVGPPTAGDETDPVTGQTMSFSVMPATGFTQQQIDDMFSVAPSVSSTGTLSFTAAADAVGTVVVSVQAVDSGDHNPARGDDNMSPPVLLTLTLAPVNDAPIANPDSVSYELDEDNAVDIPLTNGNGTGLYDIFSVGPANEADPSAPGGNQSFATDSSLYPATTVGGGRIEPYFQGGQLAGLRYTPALDFNGTDTFVYGVRDDGQTFDFNTGQLVNDPRESYATVSLTVNAVNDRPQFAGGVDVVVEEDVNSDNPDTPPSDVGLSIIDSWATNILPGPATAIDEANQSLVFNLTHVGGDAASSLFDEMPTVDPTTGQLRFKTLSDANGSAIYEAVLQDDGPTGFLDNDPSRPMHQNTSIVRTFTISVTPVNDVPTFTPGPVIQRDEDSGPFNQIWATNISPGPADEVAEGQAVLFDVVLSAADRAKFSVQPTISDSGLLRFTPANDANGTVVALVTARDTAGAVANPPVPLTIDIAPINDRPIGVDDSLSSNEDVTLQIPASLLMQNDIDVDLPNDSLAILEITSPSLQGAAVTLSQDGSTVTYDPSTSQSIQGLRPGESASDVFTYRIVDSAGAASEPATVTITLSGVNDAPVAGNDTPAVDRVNPTTFAPLANDSDVDGSVVPSSIVVTLQPANGTLDVDSNGLMTYTPFSNFPGTDLIRYVVYDDLGLVSNQATISITVNDAPTALDDYVTTYRNEAITFNPLANDTDPNDAIDPSTVEIIGFALNGTAVANSDGTITYTPDTDFFGTDQVTYQVRDVSGTASNVAAANIRVIPSRLQNPQNALDVNASGEVSPIDALLIINHLNRGGSTDINDLLPGPPFLDVDGNLVVAPVDALRVINFLNRTGTGEGEAGPLGGPLFGSQLMGAGFRYEEPAPGLSGHEDDFCTPAGVEEAQSWDWSDYDSDDLDGLLASITDEDERVPTEAEFEEVWSQFGAIE